MSLKLRPYQEAIINSARDLMSRGVRKILIQAPTGSGKTALTASMLGTAAARGLDSWFIVHRRELVNQSTAAFDLAGVQHGIISSGFIPNHSKKVQVCSIGTLKNRYGILRKPRLIVWDECHHQSAGTWAKIFEAFPGAYHIGLTATPQRLDGSGLDKFYSAIVNGPSVSWLIDNGFLSKYKLYAPTNISVAGVHSRMGDFVKSELEALMDKPTITGCAIGEYMKRAKDKRAVVFAVSIEHSKHIAYQFCHNGIKAEHVDGETNIKDRDAAIARFRSGETKVLTNVDLFGEGFDLPAIECAILLRPTKSLGLYLQQVGRTLRPSPGKDCAIILDHVGNYERHGLPDDDREWTLSGRKKINKRQDSVSVRVCPSCFAAQPMGGHLCMFCGFMFEVKKREIEIVDGDLVEVDHQALRKSRLVEVYTAKTMDDLVSLGRKRGYKNPYWWAKQVFNNRQRKKLRGG